MSQPPLTATARTAVIVVLTLVLTVGTVLAAPPSPAQQGPGVRPVGAPGDMSQIRLVSTTTADGWTFAFYRNMAYPCAIEGYQTFTIATRVGEDPDAVAPLWVYMHGGGIGWFSPDGTPRPARNQKVEETAERQRRDLFDGELLRRIAADDETGFRMMAVSMCDHDIYGGPDIPDPNNPNRLPGGAPRTVNGLFATKAAVQYALTRVPTDDYFLYGTSAGSFGTWHVAWGLEQMGIAPTGTVADSGVLNVAWQELTILSPECGRGEEAATEIPKRLHPDIVDPANDPGRLIAEGRLATPVLDIFSIGDPNQCGQKPIECPIEGETVTMGSVECLHEPVRRAIADEGPASRSLSMDLCVTRPGPDEVACATHVPTNNDDRANTRAPWPADYNARVVEWVHERLDDDGAGPAVPTSTSDSFAMAALTDFLGETTTPRFEAARNALGAGQTKASFLRRLTTSDAWLTSIVEGFYLDTLGRPGEADGVAFWVEELASGRRPVARVAAEFYSSPEFYAGAGEGTDEGWVSRLYERILERDPEPDGLAFWVRETRRTRRGSVALRFYQTAESAGTRVTTLYESLLGRAASPTDITYWGPRVVREGDLALAVNLAVSAEYQARAEARFPAG